MRLSNWPGYLTPASAKLGTSLLDRNVQSRKMIHAALLLLMLEAVNTDLVFHHQPEAQHPKSSAIHKPPADYPIYAGQTSHPGAPLINSRAHLMSANDVLVSSRRTC